MSVCRVLTLDELDRGKPCTAVSNFDEARELAVDLTETMRVSPGCVGLAAPQIGVDRRVFVVDVSTHKKSTTSHGLIVLANPEIIVAEELQMAREGCMSVPTLTGDVARASRLTVRGLDLVGEEIEITTDGFEARAILHEIDHLDGLVFLDRVSNPNRLHTRRVYQ